MDMHDFNTYLNQFIRDCSNNVLNVQNGEVLIGHEQNIFGLKFSLFSD